MLLNKLSGEFKEVAAAAGTSDSSPLVPPLLAKSLIAKFGSSSVVVWQGWNFVVGIGRGDIIILGVPSAPSSLRCAAGHGEASLKKRGGTGRVAGCKVDGVL
jgi:hypothetical protein